MAQAPTPAPRATPTGLLAGLSHALDLTEGHPRGHAERACAIGLRLADLIGLPGETRADLMHATLLKDAGCSSNAARVYEMFGGPEHGVKRAAWEADWRKLGPRLVYALRWAERGGSPLARFRRLASLAAMGPHGGRELFQIRCARGAEIATRIGLSADAAQAIHDMDEHWDGGGHPRGLRGEEIPLMARLMGIAQVMEIFWGIGGPPAALEVVAARAGTWFQPQLAAAVQSLGLDDALWDELAGGDLARVLCDAGPLATSQLSDSGVLDRIAEAFALIIDGKSPYTYSHSDRVAQYAVRLGQRLGLPPAGLTRLRRAALVHDLGKLTVPNSILDSPNKLTAEEWSVVRAHPAYTYAILERVPELAELALDAASHHERMDGRGYHRGLAGCDLSLTARILAVADVTDALAADRPYRAGMPPDQVLGILRDGRGSHFCPTCVDACSPDLVALEPTARLVPAA